MYVWGVCFTVIKHSDYLFKRTRPGAWPTLWRHHWQEVSEFLCTKAPLVGGSRATPKITQNPRKCFLWRATNVTFSKNRGSRHQKKTALRVLQCVAVCCSVLQCVAVCCSVLQCVCCPIPGRRTKNIKQQSNPPNAHPHTHCLLHPPHTLQLAEVKIKKSPGFLVVCGSSFRKQQGKQQGPELRVVFHQTF